MKKFLEKFNAFSKKYDRVLVFASGWAVVTLIHDHQPLIEYPWIIVIITLVLINVVTDRYGTR